MKVMIMLRSYVSAKLYWNGYFLKINKAEETSALLAMKT